MDLQGLSIPVLYLVILCRANNDFQFLQFYFSLQTRSDPATLGTSQSVSIGTFSDPATLGTSQSVLIGTVNFL